MFTTINKHEEKQYTFEKAVCILIFLMGVFMSLAIPTWMTPDEVTHINQIGTSIGNEYFAQHIVVDLDLDPGRMMYQADEKMDIDQQLAIMVKSPDYTKQEMMPQKISLSVIKHLPACIGILVGVIFELPSYWALQMGELFSLLFYIFVCYQALKITPIKKQLFAGIMMIPMALQQAGCIGYDVVLISASFYYIAYILYLRFEKTEIEGKDILKLFGLLFVIAYVKIPYILLGGLIFILPLEKIKIKIGKIKIEETNIRKWRFPVLFVCVVLMAAFVYIKRDTDMIRLLTALIESPGRTFLILFNSIRYQSLSLAGMAIGCFGWTDTQMRYKFVALYYLLLLFLSFFTDENNENKYKFKKWDYIVMTITFAALFIFIFVSMVSYTINLIYNAEISEVINIKTYLIGLKSVVGVQGRYFIPFMILPFIMFPQWKHISKKNVLWITTFAVVIVVYIHVAILLLQRFWIA